MRGGRQAADRRGADRRPKPKREHDMTMDPNRVLIFDTTLRDGEQSPGISLNTAEKLEIAHQLARLGVDIIEAGFPIASNGDFEAVQAISREVREPVITGLARANPAGIHRCWGAIREAEPPPIPTFVSTSDIHIVHQMQGTREDVLGLARASVAQAKGYCDDVEFSPMDATRADVEFTAEVLQIALDEGATTINIPDTVGYAMPQEYADFLGRLYELVPGLRDIVLSVHCHDDLGLAVANSFAGVQAGARQVECAVNGIGERAGNASLEEIVMLLRTRTADVGLTTGIATRELARTSRLVSRLTGYMVQPNKAIVGRNAFAHESGIHQDGVLKERTTYRSWTRPPSGWSPTRWSSASTPAATRCVTRWPNSASRSTARRSTPPSSASRRSRTRRSRSARWTSRRSSPMSCATPSPPTRSSGSTSRRR